jgi:hypothetical protein
MFVHYDIARTGSNFIFYHSLLQDIHRFVEREQNYRNFLKALFNRESRVAAIELFYRRIGTTTKAFQVGDRLW